MELMISRISGGSNTQDWTWRKSQRGRGRSHFTQPILLHTSKSGKHHWPLVNRSKMKLACEELATESTGGFCTALCRCVTPMEISSSGMELQPTLRIANSLNRRYD